MGDFLDVASDLLRSSRVENKKEHFERVFSTIAELQVVHSKAELDLTNIESIFTVLELGKVIQRVPGMEHQEISSAIAALKELIVKTLEMTIGFPTDRSYIGVPKPYDEFADLLTHLRSKAFPTQTVSIISFNYDIAADMALYRASLGPDYVVAAPNHHAPVQLLKLHGSLNWAVEKDSEKIVPLHLSQYLNEYSIYGHNKKSTTLVPIGSQLQAYFAKNGITVLPEPVIVPPSWNKADYHHALSDIWAEAAKNLSEAEYIFVIGYSLPETDSFFRHLYALGSVGKTILRRFIVFNPDESGAVDARFKALLGTGAQSRYQYRPVTFETAISQIKHMFPEREH